MTNQVLYTQGLYKYMYSKQTVTKTVNIIDTVGFCDTVFTSKQIFDMIKSSVETNLIHIDKVVVVCSDRLQHTHITAIQQFMKWLQYAQ